MEGLKKNVNSVLALGLAVLCAGGLLLRKAQYCFRPASYLAFAAVCVCVAIGAAVAAVRCRKGQNKASRICGFLMPVFAALWSLSLELWLNCQPTEVRFGYLLPIVLGIALQIPAYIIFFSCFRNGKLRAWAGIAVGVWGLFLVFNLAIILIFSGMGTVTVSQTAVSEDGRYAAWVQVSDEGALGGSVAVYVREQTRDRPLGVGTLQGRDYHLETFRWGTEIELVWQSPQTLRVNETVYDMEAVAEGRLP